MTHRWTVRRYVVPGLIAGLESHTAIRGDDSAWGFNAGLPQESAVDIVSAQVAYKF